jgi:hypothetical protein
VQNQKKVVAGIGVKQVNQATSAEKNTLVTTRCFIGTAGNRIPPAMVFPHVHLKQFMIKDAPPGTLHVVTHSG